MHCQEGLLLVRTVDPYCRESLEFTLLLPFKVNALVASTYYLIS